MNLWLIILLTALLSTALTLLGLCAVYRFQIKSELDARMAEVRTQVADLEQRVAAGVRQGIADALRDVSDTAVRTTARSVVKMG